MKKHTRHYSCLIAAVLILALVCVYGCAESKPIAADEDDSLAGYTEYADYYDNEILDSAMELAKIVGDSWYADGDYAADSSENGWLLDYAVSAHTQDGRGVFALHNPGSAGMSQVDFILLTTKDYGRTWVHSAGVYHIVGDIAQVAINGDHVYLVISSNTYGHSNIMLSEDFGGTFKTYHADQIIPAKYRTRMSDLYNVYMRIVNAQSNGDIVLECYCDGYLEDMGSGDFQEYDCSFMSNDEMGILILSSDAEFSEVKTLYADESIFS